MIAQIVLGQWIDRLNTMPMAELEHHLREIEPRLTNAAFQRFVEVILEGMERRYPPTELRP